MRTSRTARQSRTEPDRPSVPDRGNRREPSAALLPRAGTALPVAPAVLPVPREVPAVAAPLPHPWPELRRAPAPPAEGVTAPVVARQLARVRRLIDEQSAV